MFELFTYTVVALESVYFNNFEENLRMFSMCVASCFVM